MLNNYAWTCRREHPKKTEKKKRAVGTAKHSRSCFQRPCRLLHTEYLVPPVPIFRIVYQTYAPPVSLASTGCVCFLAGGVCGVVWCGVSAVLVVSALSPPSPVPPFRVCLCGVSVLQPHRVPVYTWCIASCVVCGSEQLHVPLHP